MKWTEALVVDALRETFLPETSNLDAEEWAMLTQVPLRSPRQGEVPAAVGGKWALNERTIDVLLVRNWAGGTGHERLAIEVKVSLADYRNETDLKRAPAYASAHRCCYAAPAGLIDPDTLPYGWGLIEVHEDTQDHGRTVGSFRSRCLWRKTAGRHLPTAEPDYLISAGFRRASRAEERIRRGESEAAEVARLRDETERLHQRLHRAEVAVRRERDRAKAARGLLLAIEGMQECADCERKVTYKRGGHADGTWQHVEPGADAACHEARKEADRLRREAATGTTYAWGFPGPVEPRAVREALADADSDQEAS